MNSIICDAIRAKRRLRFVYDGYERIVEPHVYGITTANHEAMRGWLVAGWSESEAAPGWRTYLEREMHDVHALAQPFDGPREGYVADDRQMRQVYCRLEAASAAARPEGPARGRDAAPRDGARGDAAPPEPRP